MSLSPYLLAIAIAWVVAQGLKYVIVSIRTKSLGHLRQLYVSGNMPSAHSASVVSLVTLIGLIEGIDTAVFALAALFAAIVMYDAVMVRRSSGEQGEAILKLISLQKTEVKKPRVAKGHTPMEVLAGAFVGGVIGLVVFLATK